MRYLALLLSLLSAPLAAKANISCTLIHELGAVQPILRQGACDTRVSPASTFKIAISLMGYDSGILTSQTEPKLPFHEGYADWMPAWRQDTTPQSWIRDSVVWYSQRVTEQLGAERFRHYVDAFDYGNRDLRGRPGRNDGLTRAWLSASLRISPDEQAAFLSRMIEGVLPVSAGAVAQTRDLLDAGVQEGGWRVYGKTGGGLLPAGGEAPDRKRPFGWYVGWVENGARKVVFVHLVTFEGRMERPVGWIARDQMMELLFAPNGPLEGL